MKIGIIIQPLHTNYGGLLQNYALQQVLTKLGHEVYTINKNTLGIYSAPWDKRIKFCTKQNIKKIIGRPYMPSYKEWLYIRQHCARVVEQEIKTTPMFKTQEGLKTIIEKCNFDAYVAGSDQVWRPCYSQNIYNDFLDFCQEKTGIKRVAYAASFGVDNWEFNEEETKKCSELAKLFNAISVREDSGMHLCKEHLGVEAIHVLDPTMLLEKEDYIELVNKVNEKPSNGNLFCYILDNSEAIQKAIIGIEQKEELKSFMVKAKNTKLTLAKNEKIEDHVIPSPTKWLRAFMDAKMVFTDSFHGCVFSIIFNKPFWVIGNKGRGNARFDSLLKLFNLECRRVDINDIDNIDFTAPIDWNEVNTIKKACQEKSINFIKEYL